MKARRQYSFSRLSGRLQRQAEALPADRDEWKRHRPPRSTRGGLGTLVHAVLADPDLAPGVDVADLVRRHASRHFPAGPVPNFAPGTGLGTVPIFAKRKSVMSPPCGLPARLDSH